MSHSTHSPAPALPQAVPYRQPENGNDEVKVSRGCAACSVIGPQLTAADTAGRTWMCSCGTAWVHVKHAPRDCGYCAGVLVRAEDGTAHLEAHLQRMARLGAL